MHETLASSIELPPANKRPPFAITRILMALTLGMASISALAQSQDPVVIGLVLAKTGYAADPGTDSARGAMIEAEQHHSEVLGRPLKVIWYDEPDPQGAGQNTTRLIEQDKAVAVMGGVISSSAFAMAAVANRAKVPLIVVTAGSEQLTGSQCSRYVFRTGVTVSAAMAATEPAMLKKGKKWYFLSPDYAFGKQIYDNGVAYLTAHGGTVLGNELVGTSITDFSSQILKMRQADPDVIVAGLGGGALPNFLKQYRQYNMRATVSTPIVSDSMLWGAGEQHNVLMGKPWHYSDPTNSTEEKAFTKLWRAKYQVPPSTSAWQGWMSMRMLLAAIEQGKSTTPPAIVHGLETVHLDGGVMPNYYRPWDHQFIHQLDIVDMKPAGEDKWDVATVVDRAPKDAADIDAFFGTPAQIGCKMAGL